MLNEHFAIGMCQQLSVSAVGIAGGVMSCWAPIDRQNVRLSVQPFFYGGEHHLHVGAV